MTQTQTNNPASREVYLKTARDIGLNLAKNAIWDGNRCNWLGSALEPIGGKFQIVTRTFAPDMYSGTSGIAYFLTQLYRATPDQIIRETLEGTVRQMLSVYAAAPTLLNHSFYTGKIGLAYTLLQAGHTLQKKEWLKKAIEILTALKNEPLTEVEIDVISGAAGAIPALLKIHAQYPEAFIKELAIKCGDFLLERADESEIGWCWKTQLDTLGLTGYSHGTAGVASALLQLHQETQQQKYREATEKGFQYERYYFNANEQNWPDLREDSMNKETGTYVCGLAWCHGAPGIALSRLKAFQLTGNPGYRQEAEIALNTTLRGIPTDFSSAVTANFNFSLCHGLAGNCDVLISGALALNQPNLMRWAEHAGNYGIAKYGQYKLPWPSGVSDPNGVESNLETPGLMLGLAGTGYFYLRLYDPVQFESILCL